MDPDVFSTRNSLQHLIFDWAKSRCCLTSSPFIDSSVDNAPNFNQSLIEFIDISKRLPIDSLLHDTANIVSERIEAVGGHRFGEMKFTDIFMFISTHILPVLFL